VASNESKVRVRLDTRQAKGELRGFVREAGKTAGRVTGGIRNAVGRGMGAVGLGVGVGTGMQALKGATESGIGDVMSEALGPLGHRISEFFLGNLNEQARSSKTAREQTWEAYGAITAARGAIPPAAYTFFNQAKTFALETEKAKELFAAETDFHGPSMDKVLDKIMSGFETLLNKAMDYLLGKLTFGVAGGSK
jgi:hypothetical protein